MYSSLMLSDLVEARYAARLAEAQRHRQLREFATAKSHRLRSAVRLPRLRRTRPSTACATAR